MDGHLDDVAQFGNELLGPTEVAPSQAPVSLTIGRRLFIAGAAGAALGVMADSGTASAIDGRASSFRPLTPRRLTDTRKGIGFRRLDADTIRVKVAGVGGAPADAVAAVLTVTGVNRTSGGNWISAYPAGTAWPGTSSLNCAFFDHRVANLVTVKLGTSGAAKGYVDIRSRSTTDVVVDLAGVYVPAAAATSEGRFVAVDPVRRVIDTRDRGRKPGRGEVVRVNLGGTVPADALAVVANLTAVAPTGQGYLTAYPIGERRSSTSNLNVLPGQNRAVGIMTKLGSSGSVRGFDVYVHSGAHVVVDVAGYITGPGSAASTDGLFIPIDPVRMLDTRIGKRRLWPGWIRGFTLPSPMNAKAKAISANLTVTTTRDRGYFTLFAANTVRRVVSTLNATGPGQTIANHAITSVSTRGAWCYSLNGAHVVCDVTGWFTGTPLSTTVATPTNPPPPGGPIPWTLQVPRMGLTHRVFDGSPDPIVDAGHSWHWTGTGLPGQGGKSVAFGHRTEAGGPYRYQHYLRRGDPLYVFTADNRRYTYVMEKEVLTNSDPSQILQAARSVPGETFALVACTGDGNTGALNRLPGGSIRWRIVSIFKLVEWADLG